MQGSVIRNVKNYERDLQDLYAVFTCHWTNYRHSCDHLIRSLQLPQGELSRLLNSGNSAAWEGSDVSVGLQGLLGDNYQYFMLLLYGLNRDLCTFRRQLDLGEDNTVRI